MFSFGEGGDERDFGPWSRWSACSQYCGSGGVRYRVRSCIRDGDCQGETLQMFTCYRTKCYCKFLFIVVLEMKRSLLTFPSHYPESLNE